MTQPDKTQQEILDLKKLKNALILAHYYQPLEVQDIADYVCDSHAMAKKAAEAKENLIIICGVRFMAESAKILNPDKTILLPAPTAGCPMADMITADDVMALKAQHPDGKVMCYVNSSAAVKAASDVCCTSASAVHIAKALDTEKIIFVPDRHMGEYVSRQVPEKEFILWQGFCPTHYKITEKDVLKAKSALPNAKFAAHPECRTEVLKHADYIGSTAGIIEFTRETEASEIIIGTEMGVLERLQRELPNKKLYCVSAGFICPNMKKTGVSEVLNSLKNNTHEIIMSTEEINAARQSLDRMITV